MFVSLYIQIYKLSKNHYRAVCQFHESLRQCNIALAHFQYKCISSWEAIIIQY